MTKLARPITRDEVHTYNRAGFALLRGVLDVQTVNRFRRSMDQAIASLADSPAGYDVSEVTRAAEACDFDALQSNSDGQHDLAGMVAHIKATEKPLLLDPVEGKGSFLLDTGVAARIREFRKLCLSGVLPEIAAAFLDSEAVNFFGDQIFVKEPGTRERTAFHQDSTYFNIEGDQCCVVWVPVDPASYETGTMLYVRGIDGKAQDYQPNTFVSHASLPGAEGAELPDIENNLDAYDVVHFDVEPGDVLVHHYKTIHGTSGNASRYQVRRAASLRYCGDDIRYRARPYAPKQLHLQYEPRDGEPLGGPDFPIVWQRTPAQQAA